MAESRSEGRAPLIKDFISLAGLDDLVFGAWDPISDNAYEAAVRCGVLDRYEHIEPIADFLKSIEPMPAAFEQRCRDWPLVRECHMLNGEIDFILKCVAPDLTTFQNFLTRDLTAAPNVASVKTSLVIRASKHDPGVPIEIMPASGRTARAGERARP